MKKEQVFLCFILILSSTGFSLISPIFPPLFKERQISNQICSYIIATFSFVQIFITLYSPFIIGTFGRRKLFLSVIIIQTISTFFYGLMVLIPDNILFITFGFINRGIQGFCNVIIDIITYSITSVINNENEIQVATAYIELSFTLGLTIGPLIVGIFFKIGGYILPFIVAGLFTSIGIYLYFQINIPENDEDNEIGNNLNDKKDLETKHLPQSKNDEISEKEEKKSNKKSLFPFLLYPEIDILVLTIMININSLNFQFPVLSNVLKDKFGMSPDNTAIFFSIYSLGYLLSTQFINQITDFFGFYSIGFIGIFMSGLFTFLLAPIPIFPQKYYIMVIGQLGIGFLSVFVSVCLCVVLNNSIKQKVKNENIAGDITGALYNISFYIGEVWETILSSWLTDLYSYEITVYTTSGLSILFSGIFFLFYRKEIVKEIFNLPYKKNMEKNERDLMIELKDNN